MTATTHPFNTAGLEPNDVRFAWVSLQTVCGVLGVDPQAAITRRRKDAALLVRKIWHYVLRPHITGTLIAKITGFNRTMVEDDAKEVSKWRVRNRFIDERIDAIADMMEPVRALSADAEALLEECALEREEIAKGAPMPQEPVFVQTPQAKPHPFVALLNKSRDVTRALGPIRNGIERPEGASAWAYVEDSTGAHTIRIGWAGARDTLKDAEAPIREALRIAGLYASAYEVLSHPKLNMKYQATIRISTKVSIGTRKPQGAAAR